MNNTTQNPAACSRLDQQRRPSNGQASCDAAGPIDLPFAAPQVPPQIRDLAGAVLHAMEPHQQRRAINVFLGRADCLTVKYEESGLIGRMMMQCLPVFVRQCGGDIVLTRRLEADSPPSPVECAVELLGRQLQFILEATSFVWLPDQRATVSSRILHPGNGTFAQIEITATANAGGFYGQWRSYTMGHNYLRGQAFFPDGTLVHRDRQYTWDDIFLSNSVKSAIRLHVEGFLRHAGKLRKLGLKGRRGLLLSGAPGTGKTLLGKVLSQTVPCSFIWVLPEHVDYPETVQSIFKRARFVAPAILFLEDIDLYGGDRDEHAPVVLGELMNHLDGADDNQGIVTIATTNRLELVEKALRNRPGRFDQVIKMGGMELPCREQLLRKVLRHAMIAEDDRRFLLAHTDGRTGAQLEELANTLHLMALEEQGATGPRNHDDGVLLSRRLIDAALAEMQPAPRSTIGFQET